MGAKHVRTEPGSSQAIFEHEALIDTL